VIRVLTLVVVLGLAAGVAVLAAHQEDSDTALGLGITGLVVLGGTLFFVAYRRGAWRPWNGNAVLAVTLAGLVAVITAGSSAVSQVVLTTRGEQVDVVVVALDTEADAKGYRSYAVVTAAESTPLRGALHTREPLNDGEVVTVLADPAGFVRPLLPADTATTTFVLIALAGVALLVATTLRTGFPLTTRDGVHPEQNRFTTS
jgi:hypothetical protein